jgi:hypothetical protein
MKRLLTVCALALCVLASSACLSLAQTTINFDDLPGTDGSIPNGYQGLDWSNFDFVDPVGLGGLNPSGYINGIVSPDKVAFNNNGLPASFSSASIFTVNSLYITAAWREGLNVLIEGLASASVIHSLNVVIGSLSPTLVNLNWDDVDQVTFTPSGGTHNPDYPNGEGTHVAIDDITINGRVSSVPEGSSIAMLLLGGLPVAFGVLRKRKRA